MMMKVVLCIQPRHAFLNNGLFKNREPVPAMLLGWDHPRVLFYRARSGGSRAFGIGGSNREDHRLKAFR